MGFIDEYFLSPIRVEQGYNFVNTVTYAIIALVLIYIIFNVFKRFNIKLNFEFLLAMFPFILIGSSLRVFVDMQAIFRNFWTVSPGIYLLLTSTFLFCMFVGVLLERQKLITHWQSFTISSGIFLILIEIYFFSSNLNFENMDLAFLIIFILSVLNLIFYKIFSKLNWKWICSRFGFAAFFAHLLDSVVTAIILFFVGGWEKHPLPRFFIEKFGPFSFIPLKLLVIIPSIYIISKEIKDIEFRNFLFMAITVLGLAEGIRNFIALILK